jgi:FkbM family methyltransferase
LTVQQADLLRELLSVPPDVVERRALDLFERESGAKYPTPLVLCGLGRLGRITLDGLRRAGIEPVALADNNPSLQGSRLTQHEVLSVEEAVRRHGGNAVFVVTVYTARPLREQLAGLGARVASSRAVFFQHPDLFLPHGSIQWPPEILADSAKIIAGLNIWHDDESRREYLAQIEWQLLGRTDMPSWVPGDQTYFPKGLIALGDHESFVDCGAFDGDTIRTMIDRTNGRFASLLALEPDPDNFAALRRFIATLPADVADRIEIFQVAAHSHAATLRFESGSGAGSNLSVGGDLQVDAVALDDLLLGRTTTFLKMDIEGAEPVALLGARKTLSTQAPRLAICVYHRREHLWEVPRIVCDSNPRYSCFLRRHSDESWESVCYAIPH